MNYNEFTTLQEAEFELLQELGDVKSIINIAERNIERLKRIFNGYYILVEIVKKEDINILAKNLVSSHYTRNNYLTFQNQSNLNINCGEIFILFCARHENKIEKILKIQKDVLEDNFLKNMSEKNISINKEKLNKFTITKDKIKNFINTEYSKKKNIEKEEEKEALKVKTEKEKEDKKLENDFEKKCLCQFKDIFIAYKSIINGNKEYKLNRNVNKIFSFEWLKSKSYSYHHNLFNSIKEYLINSRENFKKNIYNDINGKKKILKIYNIEFEKEKDIRKKQILRKFDEKRQYKGWIKVNGVKVSENKLDKVLGSIKEKTTKEQIEYINKFSGMKVEAITLKSINTENNTNIEINISPIKQDKFIIDFLSNKETVDWNFIKKYFFYGGGSRRMSSYMSINDLLEFIKELRLTKEDLFTHLKREKMLKKLK